MDTLVSEVTAGWLRPGGNGVGPDSYKDGIECVGEFEDEYITLRVGVTLLTRVPRLRISDTAAAAWWHEFWEGDGGFFHRLQEAMEDATSRAMLADLDGLMALADKMLAERFDALGGRAIELPEPPPPSAEDCAGKCRGMDHFECDSAMREAWLSPPPPGGKRWLAS